MVVGDFWTINSSFRVHPIKSPLNVLESNNSSLFVCNLQRPGGLNPKPHPKWKVKIPQPPSQKKNITQKTVSLTMLPGIQIPPSTKHTSHSRKPFFSKIPNTLRVSRNTLNSSEENRKELFGLHPPGSRYMGVSLNGGTPKTPQNDHF